VRSAITGSGLTSTAYTIPAGVPPCAGQFTLNAAPPAAFSGNGSGGTVVWLAIEPYTSNCEVLAVTNVTGTEVTVWPSTVQAHGSNAPAAFLEDGVLTPQLFGFSSTSTGDASVPINAALTALSRLVASRPPADNCAGTGACTNGPICPAGAACTAGGTLFLPRGTYPTQNPINVPEHTSIRGDGPASVIQYTGTGSAISWRPSPGCVNQGLAEENSTTAFLSNFQITATPGSGAVSAIDLIGYEVTLQDVIVNGATSSPDGGIANAFSQGGIVIDTSAYNSSVINIFSCHILGCAGPGIRITTNNLNAVTVQSCRIEGNQGAAIDADPAPTNCPTSNLFAVARIEGNLLEANAQGLLASQGGSGITGSFVGSRIANNFFSEAPGVPAFFLFSNATYDPQECSHLGQWGTGIEIAGNVSVHAPSSAAPSIYFVPGIYGFGATIRNNCLNPGSGQSGSQACAIWCWVQRHSTVRANWVNPSATAGSGPLPVVNGSCDPTVDYGLIRRVYRFQQSLSGTSGTVSVPIAADSSMSGYALPWFGHVLQVSAYLVGSPPSGASANVVSVQAGTASVLSSSLGLSASAPFASWATSTLGAPQFGTGASLGVTANWSNFAPASGVSLVVEVTVGLGSAGGGSA
jgi:hypothetical protein